MSANLVIDIGGSCVTQLSLPAAGVAADYGLAVTSGGAISSLSGVLVGDTIDLLHADAACNVFACGRGFGSGPLLIGIQTADVTTSGSFTDPTSGLAAADRPRGVSSGGFVIIGSGAATDVLLGVFGSGVSGQVIQSGFAAFVRFERPHRYARLIVGSGFYDGTLLAGFVSQARPVGSGGGFSMSPSSGSVTV